MINIVGKRFWFLTALGAVILFSIISLAKFGLKPGVEFSSGSMLTVSFEQTVAKADLNQELVNLGHTEAVIQRTGEGNFLIRTSELSSEDKLKLENALTARFGPLTIPQFDSVSPMAAAETVRNTGIGVAIACVGMILYIAWAFRKMPNPFHYSICAIIALAHDTLLAVGVFSILGATRGWEINLMFITGILAVIGYSINDTVVVFDRIRENLRKGVSTDFEVIVNNSIVETIGRCLNTALTTLFVVLALLLFVGASIQGFTVVLLIGITAGTFSSMLIAPSLLIVWEKKEWGRLFRRSLATNRAKGR